MMVRWRCAGAVELLCVVCFVCFMVVTHAVESVEAGICVISNWFPTEPIAPTELIPLHFPNCELPDLEIA